MKPIKELIAMIILTASFLLLYGVSLEAEKHNPWLENTPSKATIII